MQRRIERTSTDGDVTAPGVEKYQAVQEMVFEELHLPAEIAAAAQQALFCCGVETG